MSDTIESIRSDSDMVCEAHPYSVWPHGECIGPGMPYQYLLEMIEVGDVMETRRVENQSGDGPDEFIITVRLPFSPGEFLRAINTTGWAKP